MIVVQMGEPGLIWHMNTVWILDKYGYERVLPNTNINENYCSNFEYLYFLNKSDTYVFIFQIFTHTYIKRECTKSHQPRKTAKPEPDLLDCFNKQCQSTSTNSVLFS